jgi:hypothetical protein
MFSASRDHFLLQNCIHLDILCEMLRACPHAILLLKISVALERATTSIADILDIEEITRIVKDTRKKSLRFVRWTADRSINIYTRIMNNQRTCQQKL